MQPPAPASRGTPRKRVHEGSAATASETSRQLHASGAERVAVRVGQYALHPGPKDPCLRGWEGGKSSHQRAWPTHLQPAVEAQAGRRRVITLPARHSP